ncbi:MAG: protein-L-isoaspartate O-methyltransferase [Archaeoglobaceae archaeon]
MAGEYQDDLYRDKRVRMANRLLEEFNLSLDVFEAMKKVPRHEFVPYERRNEAYSDIPLPIGEGQTISAPHMVAIMCNLLDLQKGDKVLEVGGGRGYHAAVVAEIVDKEGKVIAMEIKSELARISQETLEDLGYYNVRVITGDGSKGYPPESPFDKIYVTASAPEIPEPLMEQLKPGGKMVIPIGEYMQYLYVVEKDDQGNINKRNWGGVRFVPLVGEYGVK